MENYESELNSDKFLDLFKTIDSRLGGDDRVMRLISEYPCKWRLMHFPISEISFQEGSVKASLSQYLINKCSKMTNNGSKTPPVFLFRSGANFEILDGHHRIAMYIAKCKSHVWAYVSIKRSG